LFTHIEAEVTLIVRRPSIRFLAINLIKNYSFKDPNLAAFHISPDILNPWEFNSNFL
jgi:hypothetical protein